MVFAIKSSYLPSTGSEICLACCPHQTPSFPAIIAIILVLVSRGFEDAFASPLEDGGMVGRNRRLSTQSRLGGDPESMRAEQLLAAGAAAMQMGEGTAQKSKSGR